MGPPQWPQSRLVGFVGHHAMGASKPPPGSVVPLTNYSSLQGIGAYPVLLLD